MDRKIKQIFGTASTQRYIKWARTFQFNRETVYGGGTQNEQHLKTTQRQLFTVFHGSEIVTGKKFRQQV